VLPVAAVGRAGTVEARALGAQPALTAPGKDLTGLAPAGNGQVVASAAELAVAFVAGSAALVRARYPDLAVDAVRTRLTGTADHPPGTLPHPTLGFGMVDPTGAVTSMASAGDTRVATPDTAAPALAHPTVPDQRPARLALLVSAVVVGVALLAALIGVTVASARRRAR
jgi:membrane-anchored mycosin MYCP